MTRHLVTGGAGVIGSHLVGIDGHPMRCALAASLVSFAARIGATLTADSIETQRELEALHALGEITDKDHESVGGHHV